MVRARSPRAKDLGLVLLLLSSLKLLARRPRKSKATVTSFGEINSHEAERILTSGRGRIRGRTTETLPLGVKSFGEP